MWFNPGPVPCSSPLGYCLYKMMFSLHVHSAPLCFPAVLQAVWTCVKDLRNFKPELPGQQLHLPEVPPFSLPYHKAPMHTCLGQSQKVMGDTHLKDIC